MDEQLEIVFEQRGWKRHPGGNLSRPGGLPLIVLKFSVRRSDIRAQLKSASVYGCLGDLNNLNISASYTICPAYIT